MTDTNHTTDNIRERARYALESVEIGDPVHWRGLTLFPLTCPHSTEIEYDVLEDALEAGTVEITEVSTGGSVPDLIVNNTGDKHLLVLDGEELVGGKQNRILNISTLIPAKTKVTIPVSCVEAGRWNRLSQRFSAGSFAPTKIRATLKADLIKHRSASNTFRANQARVWREVDYFMEDLRFESPTNAMHEGFKSREKEIRDFHESLNLPESATGYLACAGELVLGGDLFDKPETLRRKWNRLFQSSIVEALRFSGEVPATDRMIAERFLQNATESISDTHYPPGIGKGVNIEGKEVLGSVLLADGQMVHAALFPNVE